MVVWTSSTCMTLHATDFCLIFLTDWRISVLSLLLLISIITQLLCCDFIMQVIMACLLLMLFTNIFNVLLWRRVSMWPVFFFVFLFSTLIVNKDNNNYYLLRLLINRPIFPRSFQVRPCPHKPPQRILRYCWIYNCQSSQGTYVYFPPVTFSDIHRNWHWMALYVLMCH